MKTMVLGCALTFAAVAASAAPAQAMDRAPGGFSGSASGPAAGSPFPRGCFDGRRGDRHHRQGGRCAGNVVLYVYGGDWALYNTRRWEADSYNDWWHAGPTAPSRAGSSTTRIANGCGGRAAAGAASRSLAGADSRLP